MQTYNFSPIGFISSCYKEKFGIPRQSGLVKSAPASLILNQEFSEESVRGLEDFSHLWISFVFHANSSNQDIPWKQMVRPPRLGGNEKVGVFASRSPFRPNPMGLSAVEIDSIEHAKNSANHRHLIIKLRGCDLLDGTPVLDIKPYIPYADSISDALAGFAKNKPDAENFSINFTPQAQQQCDQIAKILKQDITATVIEILKLDPRPSYKSNKLDDKVYSMKLFDFDLKWQYCENGRITVLNLSS